MVFNIGLKTCIAREHGTLIKRSKPIGLAFIKLKVSNFTLLFVPNRNRVLWLVKPNDNSFVFKNVIHQKRMTKLIMFFKTTVISPLFYDTKITFGKYIECKI